MTEPSQYFKGRTVQEQMNEVIGYVDVRSAEVATDAIAADVAQVHQDMLDADADAAAAAASAAAAAGVLANAVKKTGEASQNIAGDIAVSGDLTGGTVTVPTPVNNTDAASKQYVDNYHDATKLNISDVNSYALGLTGNQLARGEKKIPDINNNRIELTTGSGESGWRKVYAWTGQATFMFTVRSQTGTRRNGCAILCNVSVGSPTMIGDGTNWNDLSKILIGTATTKQVAIASDADGNVGVYYNFPNSETTIIEIIGSAKATDRLIAITPVVEDPTTLPYYLVV